MSQAPPCLRHAHGPKPTEVDAAPTTQVETTKGKRIVAITACPTGIAHTFMAAKAPTTAATSGGHEIKVETQGSVGAKNQLTDEEIDKADVVIIAADTHVDLARFAGKPLYQTSVGAAVKQAPSVLESALAQPSPCRQPEPGRPLPRRRKAARAGPYKHLLTGVSYMLPIVVAGGLTIALSFVFGIEAFKQEGTFAAALMSIGGGAAFAIMVPVLSGFIAYSIADRPGLAPGLIGGMLAVNLQAGFLGGIASGFLAGYVAKWMRDHIKLPDEFRRTEAGAGHPAAVDAGGGPADGLRHRRAGAGRHGGDDPVPAGDGDDERAILGLLLGVA